MRILSATKTLAAFILVMLCCQRTQGQDDFGSNFFAEHCYQCHSGEGAEGGLQIDQLVQDSPLVKQLKTWNNIAKRIELGDMPPPDAGRLDKATINKFKDWFDQSISGFDYDSVASAGFVPAKRLTHKEYQNSIRDLIGIDLAEMETFPTDLSGNSGFSNSANTLFMNGSLLDCYAQSAESIIAKLFSPDANDLELRARNAILVPGQHSVNVTDRARRILKRFCDRAFRRPSKDEEIDRLMLLFESEYNQSKQLELAIQKPLIAVLLMPQFLFKIESVPTGMDAERVGQYELANRLSYFLWASMPDEQLMRLAKENRLSNPLVLDEQIDRMIRDRRGKSLGYVFAAEWLGFEDVGVRRRQDPIDNPWCTESLMKAMRDESTLFFYSLIRDDRPISALVNARYTYLNEELARHYRIKGIKGDHLRPVSLKTTRRGGILTHASILSITAFPDRTSPVVRGKWVLETLLGTPPPEPPPNVSELSPQIEDREISFRAKLALHSRNKRCAACHQEIDPLGHSLENFDNFGRWRFRRFGEKIDATGRTPDGVEFDGPEGLRKVLIGTRLDDLTRQLAVKMLSYALGRQLEYHDEAAIRQIVAATKKDNYSFQSLVKNVINSNPFQNKQKPNEP